MSKYIAAKARYDREQLERDRAKAALRAEEIRHKRISAMLTLIAQEEVVDARMTMRERYDLAAHLHDGMVEVGLLSRP